MTVYTYSFERPSFELIMLCPPGFELNENSSAEMALVVSVALGLPQQTVQVRGNLGVYTINRVSAVGGDLTSRVQSATRFNVTIELPPDSSAIFAGMRREPEDTRAIEELARELAEDIAAEPPGEALPASDGIGVFADQLQIDLNPGPGSGASAPDTSKPRPFECPTCSKTYMQKCHLDAHINSAHTQQVSFSCRTCSKSFFRAEHCRRHELGHENLRNFRCAICTALQNAGEKLIESDGRTGRRVKAAFNYRSFALRHMRDVHGLSDDNIEVEELDGGVEVFSKKE
ncbi:MAG: hypothetical protein H7A36_03765 [Chlamydiales bacterium]|nr:hypothetical protein [Chlamydiales bacterium]